MSIQDIIKELINKQIITTEALEYNQLSGGTSSELYLLSNKDNGRYVVKMNEPKVLEAEVYFYDFYKNIDLLPSLIHIDKSFQYMVYSYIQGSSQHDRKNKKELLQSLVHQLINQYKIVDPISGWGWTDDLTDSWQDFLSSEVLEASLILEGYLKEEERDVVLELVKSPQRNTLSRVPYLLHGDCGVHNFIFNKGQLCGVIDPTPVVGTPLYDLIYAFCSSPDDLTKETLISAASQLNYKKDISEHLLFEEVVIGLYLRLATCIKYHSEDLEDYLKAWNYWKEQ